MVQIVLGSMSGARAKVLREMGYNSFDVIPADMDEKSIRLDDPVALTLALANAKMDIVLRKVEKPAIIITSDKVVVFNGQIREKPITDEEAKRFLMSYRFGSAETVTSVVVLNIETGLRREGTDRARINFSDISECWANAYIGTGDPFKHAGGFDHEHCVIRQFVSSIEGERESIMGLPRKLTERLIEEVSANSK